MTLGKRIQERRTSLGLSREVLSIRSKVGQKSIYNYERELRSPTVRDLKKIASALNTSLSWLMGEVDLEKKQEDIVDLPNEEEIVNQIVFLSYRPDIREAGVLRIISKILDKLSKKNKTK